MQFQDGSDGAGVGDGLAVHLANLDTPGAAVFHQCGERIDPFGLLQGTGKRDQMMRSPVEPHQRLTERQHHQRACAACRPARGFGPGNGRTVGLRRIGGGQHQGRRHEVGMQFDVGGLAHAAQPVDRARQAELRRTKPTDEVPAPRLATFFQHLQHPVDAGISTDDTFGQHRLSGDHAVPFHHLQRHGVRGHGAGGRR